MINLKTRTEYSFRLVYGKTRDIVENSKEYASITDRFNTFGHVTFYNECKKQGKKAIFGVELAFVEDAKLKVKQKIHYVTLVARNKLGLRKIYELVSKSTKQKYNVNRLDFVELEELSDDIIIIYEDSYLERYLKNNFCYYGFSPISSYSDFKKQKFPMLAISDNFFDKATSKKLYEVILYDPSENDSSKKRTFFGKNTRNEMSHILDEYEWRDELFSVSDEEKDAAIKLTYELAEGIEQFDLEQAELPKHKSKFTLWELCKIGSEKLNINLDDPIYKERLELELGVIKEKNFEDYFYLVHDLVHFAKKHMLVGPGRGSSAGSLICYLLEITDVDPIPHGLLFARFLDPSRFDAPDIDIDFQDTKRDILLGYLKNKYGEDCVAKIGTLSKYKADGTLNETAKVLNIPPWDMKDLKAVVVKRSDGDERTNDCVGDTFDTLNVGKDYLRKYPGLEYSRFIEGHVRHSGKHAGAIIVSDKDLTNYCSVDHSEECCQIDKRGATSLNLLKMDCLGLSVLSQIQTCLDIVEKEREWLINYPLEDKKVFDVINDKRYSGISQFNGQALIRITKQIEIKCFNDMVAITALARPGASDEQYIKSKNFGEISYKHILLEPILKETYGVIVYQEQVMRIVKEVGGFSWEDTAKIRKAIGGSMGSEFMDKMKDKFIFGCFEKSIGKKISEDIWQDIINMGDYAFNKSHAVAYSMLSYWCMILKAHHPLEFAVSNLRNANGTSDEAIDKVKIILRELVSEGFEFEPFNKDLSQVEWSVQGGKLIGGLTNIKGIGLVKARDIVSRRKKGGKFTVSQEKSLEYGFTPFDNIYELRDDLQIIHDNWNLFLKTKPRLIKDIDEGGDVRIICKIKEKKLRDMNEPELIKKRNGQILEDIKNSKGEVIEKVETKYLSLKFEEHGDIIFSKIPNYLFEKYGKEIMEDQEKDGYYIVFGSAWIAPSGFRFITVKDIKKIKMKEVHEKIELNSIN
ncbi:MAG: DNA polymerase III alpha subunit [Psychroserpens sp.]|jgi:DNA polymerase III alpha subunit